jgi:hypothetical protein
MGGTCRYTADGQIDVVIVYSAERLYRRVAEIDDLIEQLRDVPVHSVSSGNVDLATADGRMLARVLASMAQHESEKRGERVARAARQRAEDGGYGGGRRRFGYMKTADALLEDEAEAMRVAYKAVAAGATLESIVRDWKARFGVGSLGGKITGVQVRDPGAGRRTGEGTRWDTLHPGRAWAALQVPRAETPEHIAGDVAEYLRQRLP